MSSVQPHPARSAQFTATHLRLNLDMINNLSSGQNLVVNIPHTAYLVFIAPTTIERYRRQFANAPRPPNVGPSDPLYIDIPLNHNDIVVRTNGNPGMEITDPQTRERIWDAMGVRPGTRTGPRQQPPRQDPPPGVRTNPQQTPQMPRTITLNINGQTQTVQIPPNVTGNHINIELNQQQQQQHQQQQQQPPQQPPQQTQQPPQPASLPSSLPSNLSELFTNLSHTPVCVSVPTTDLPPDLTCSVCYDLLDDPSRGQCKCVFCKKCILTWHSTSKDASGKGSCPKCRKPFSLSDINAAGEFFDEKAPGAEVECPHGGCNVKCSLNSLRSHMKGCPWLPYTCKFKKYGCNFFGTKEKLAKHKCSMAGLEPLISKVQDLERNTLKNVLAHKKTIDTLLSNARRQEFKVPDSWFNWVELTRKAMMDPIGWHRERNKWHLFLMNGSVLTWLQAYLHFAPLCLMYVGLCIRTYRVSKGMGYCWKCQDRWWEEEDVMKEWRDNAMNDNILHLLLFTLMSLLLILFSKIITLSPISSFGGPKFNTPDWLWPIIKLGEWDVSEILCGCVLATAITVGLSLTGEPLWVHRVALVTTLTALSLCVPPFVLSMINCNRLGVGNLADGWKLDIKVKRVLQFSFKNAFAWYLLGSKGFVSTSLLTLTIYYAVRPYMADGDILEMPTCAVYMAAWCSDLWEQLGPAFAGAKNVEELLGRFCVHGLKVQRGVPVMLFINGLAYGGPFAAHKLGHKVRMAVLRHVHGTNPRPGMEGGGETTVEEKRATENLAKWVGLSFFAYVAAMVGVVVMAVE